MHLLASGAEVNLIRSWLVFELSRHRQRAERFRRVALGRPRLSRHLDHDASRHDPRAVTVAELADEPQAEFCIKP